MHIIFIRIFAVFLMIVLGAIARWTKVLDSESTTRLSHLTTKLFYPTLIYSAIVGNFTFSSLIENWTLPTGAFGIMTIGFVIGLLASRLNIFPNDAEKRGFRFQCTINNYSFLPMPLVLMFWGSTGVAKLIFSTVGSELAVWTLGIFALTGHKFGRKTLKQLLSVPMMAIVAAILTLILLELLGGTTVLDWLSSSWRGEIAEAGLNVLDIFGAGTIPAAMVIAGSRMSELRPHHLWAKPQLLVVVLRLFLIPAICLAFLMILPLNTENGRILILVATMPAAVASVVLSDLYDADSDFAAACVLLTHLVSLISVPIWISLVLQA